MLAFLSMLPVVGNIITAITTAFFNAKVQLQSSRIGGDVAIATQMVQAEIAANQTKVSWLQAVAGSPVLSIMILGFAFPFIFYLNKVIVWDICLGWGSTPPLKYGLLEQYGNIILSGIFISGTSVGVAQMYLNRSK